MVPSLPLLVMDQGVAHESWALMGSHRGRHRVRSETDTGPPAKRRVISGKMHVVGWLDKILTGIVGCMCEEIGAIS